MIDDLPSWGERPGVTPGETWNREQAGPIDAFLADAGSYALSRYTDMHRNIARRRRCR